MTSFSSLLSLTGTRSALLLAFFSSLLVSKYLSGLSHTVLIRAHWSHQNRSNASVSYRYDSRKRAKCVFLARSRSTRPLSTALLNDDQRQSIIGFHSPLRSKSVLPRRQHCRPQGMHGHSPVWRTWKTISYKMPRLSELPDLRPVERAKEGICLFISVEPGLQCIRLFTVVTRGLFIITRNVANWSSWKLKEATKRKMVSKRKWLGLIKSLTYVSEGCCHKPSRYGQWCYFAS